MFSIINQAEAKIGDWRTSVDTVVGQSGIYQQSSMSASENIASYAGAVLAVFVSLLGVLLLVQVIWAGYEWLTAQGDSGKIKEAQNRIKFAIIGVIVLVSLYAISAFVINWLGSATGYENV